MKLATASSIVVAAVACGTAAPAAPSATLPQSVDAAGFADATCRAVDELFLGVGNPDTGEKSAAWKGFESAIEGHDVALLDSSADTILTHLEAARAANARGARWTPGSSANAEFEAVLVALETQVTTVRDARGDPQVAEQASATMQTVWPRFLTYLTKMSGLIQTNQVSLPQVPCPSGGPSPSGA